MDWIGLAEAPVMARTRPRKAVENCIVEFCLGGLETAEDGDDGDDDGRNYWR